MKIWIPQVPIKMNFKLHISTILCFLIISYNGFAQNNPKNEIGLGGFANFASFSQKDGRWAAGGVRVEASRYISSKLFLSAHYGIGHLEGKDSWIFENLEGRRPGFPNLYQWGLSLQMHLLENDHYKLYSGVSYLNNRYYGVTYLFEGTPVINSVPGETTQTISTGYTNYGNWGMKIGIKNRLANMISLKTEMNYFPAFIRGQRMFDVSTGIIYSF